MTDRIQTLTVALDHDMREDDVQSVVEAIKMVRCVSDVQLGKPVDGTSYNARMAFKNECGLLLQRLILLATNDWRDLEQKRAWENIKSELDRLHSR